MGTALTGGFTLGKSLVLATAVIAVSGAAFVATQHEPPTETTTTSAQFESENPQPVVQPIARSAEADSLADASPTTTTQPISNALATASNTDTDAVATTPTGISVTGSILHADGTPIPNATVYAGYWGHEPRREKIETTADEDGVYTLYLDKPWEVFLVYGEKEGYARVRQTQVEVPDTGLVDVNLTLYHEATLEGRIIAESPMSVGHKPITATTTMCKTVFGHFP